MRNERPHDRVGGPGRSVAVRLPAHQESLGLAKVTPDEFRVVTKAPAGDPARLRPASARPGRAPAPGAAAGERRAPGPAGRAQAAEHARKARSCSCSAPAPTTPIPWPAMWWTTSSATWPTRTRASPTRCCSGARNRRSDERPRARPKAEPVNVAAEQQRLKSLTGGKPIIIKRQPSKGKLPGALIAPGGPTPDPPPQRRPFRAHERLDSH